jgi:hypothetical protein
MLLLAALSLGLTVYQPGAFIIRRLVGQVGFATETEWSYTADGLPVAANPLDPAQPKRTVEASGASIRLFDAKLDNGVRVMLKEFIGAEAHAIGERQQLR